MALKHKITQIFNGPRLLPRFFGEVLDDLDERLTAIEDVDTSELVDKSVTASKLDYFLSTEQTANGSAQNIAHGLGSDPTLVLVIPTATLAGATSFTFTHGTTNVIVTGTSGAKYQVFAMK